MKPDTGPDHEASMDILKFFRLLYARLVTQGLPATGLWLFNVFNRYLLDRPVRGQCQVTPQLFVGAQFRRRGWEILRGWGINGVVSMRDEFDNASLGLAIPHYLRLPTVDDAAPTIEHLHQGVEFMDGVIRDGGKVYVHCGAGVGRAPTMAAAYLVSQGAQPEEAWRAIRSVRKFIRPTRVQREQLDRFAHSLRA